MFLVPSTATWSPMSSTKFVLVPTETFSTPNR